MPVDKPTLIKGALVVILFAGAAVVAYQQYIGETRLSVAAPDPVETLAPKPKTVSQTTIDVFGRHTSQALLTESVSGTLGKLPDVTDITGPVERVFRSRWTERQEVANEVGGPGLRLLTSWVVEGHSAKIGIDIDFWDTGEGFEMTSFVLAREPIPLESIRKPQ